MAKWRALVMVFVVVIAGAAAAAPAPRFEFGWRLLFAALGGNDDAPATAGKGTVPSATPAACPKSIATASTADAEPCGALWKACRAEGSFGFPEVCEKYWACMSKNVAPPAQ